MPTPLLLCTLPAERADLVEIVRASGGTPLVDLTAGPRVAVPEGAWVRVRDRRAVPGTGPVILAAQGGSRLPVRGRETWLEVVEPEAAPPGFAGVVLRGMEVGGPCGARPGLDLLADLPRDTLVILDAGVLPSELPAALAAGAQGVILSDVLLGLDLLGMPPRLAAARDRAGPSRSHVVNGVRLHCSPLAPVLRRLLDGAPFWEQASGWWSADDPGERAWPAGIRLLEGRALAQEVGDLAGMLGEYVAAAERTAAPAPARPASPLLPSIPVTSGDVAVVGLGCRLPGATSLDDFWQLVKEGRSAIVEVPVERWDPALYWDADHAAPDRTYSRIGGFLTAFQFNPKRFRVPPNVARQIDPVQQWALESVADALEDAGYAAISGAGGRDFDRERTAVILGNSMGGENREATNLRVRVPAMRQALEGVPDFAALSAGVQEGILSSFEERMTRDLPTITEDTMPGELSNVIAGRVANAFDLRGPNFTVDAACAGSMAALQAAVKGLLDGDYDMAVTGGADRSMDVSTYVKFSKIGALSGEMSAPFDARASGFVMGEGCGILILKRLADAERDGDRIYAVLKGVGASSDGKGKGITAPNPSGQRLALRRAYAAAGFDPVEVDLFECHGTSTIVGDKVEVESISEVVGAGRRSVDDPIRIGSVKSNIGHLKSAAGAASVIKATLALYHKLLPPSINFEHGRQDVPFDQVPLRVQTIAEPWREPAHGPRRAGVSAFGFGGTNFHVVLEEHRPAGSPEPEPRRAPRPPVAGRALPEGVWAISADSRDELIAALKEGDPIANGRPFEPSAPVRLAAAADTVVEREGQLSRALRVLEKGQSADLLRARNIYLEEEPFNGKVAFLFTGQGSQYVDMGLDLARAYPLVQRTFEEADAVTTRETGTPISRFVHRDPSFSIEEQETRLRATEVSQPATLTVDTALLRLLAAYGVLPDMVAGHSLGEYGALVAAGGPGRDPRLRRGREQELPHPDRGGRRERGGGGGDRGLPLAWDHRPPPGRQPCLPHPDRGAGHRAPPPGAPTPDAPAAPAADLHQCRQHLVPHGPRRGAPDHRHPRPPGGQPRGVDRSGRAHVCRRRAGLHRGGPQARADRLRGQHPQAPPPPRPLHQPPQAGRGGEHP